MDEFLSTKCSSSSRLLFFPFIKSGLEEGKSFVSLLSTQCRPTSRHINHKRKRKSITNYRIEIYGFCGDAARCNFVTSLRFIATSHGAIKIMQFHENTFFPIQRTHIVADMFLNKDNPDNSRELPSTSPTSTSSSEGRKTFFNYDGHAKSWQKLRYGFLFDLISELSLNSLQPQTTQLNYQQNRATTTKKRINFQYY